SWPSSKSTRPTIPASGATTCPRLSSRRSATTARDDLCPASPRGDNGRRGQAMKLRDRVAIITGAGSGIGAASALAFAREGARILVADIDEAGAKTIVEQIERQGGQAA